MAPQCKTWLKSLVSHLRISKLSRQDLNKTYLMVHRKPNTWLFCSQYCSGVQDTANGPKKIVSQLEILDKFTSPNFGWTNLQCPQILAGQIPNRKEYFFQVSLMVIFFSQVFCAIGATNFKVKENRRRKPSVSFAT